MLKTSQLEILVAVAESGSINKAAELLFTSQPYISRSLKIIEQEIGKRLFIRTSQGVTLTRDGQYVYTHARSILSELKVLDQIKTIEIDKLHAKLDVSIYSIFLKDKIYVDFRERCSSSTTTIGVHEVNLETVLENVVKGISEVGIAVITDAEYPVVQSMANAKELRIENIASDGLCAHIGPLHKCFKQNVIEMKDLIDTTFAHIPFDIFSKNRLGIEIDGIKLSDFKKSITINSYHLLGYMVKMGESFMIGNKWQWEEFSRFGIHTARIKNCTLNVHLCVITKNKPLSSESNHFIDLVRTYYQQEFNI